MSFGRARLTISGMDERRKDRPHLLAEAGAVEWPEDHDEGLIRWMLAFSAVERLAALQSYVDGIQELRRGRRGSLPRDP